MHFALKCLRSDVAHPNVEFGSSLFMNSTLIWPNKSELRAPTIEKRLTNRFYAVLYYNGGGQKFPNTLSQNPDMHWVREVVPNLYFVMAPFGTRKRWPI